MQFELLSGRHIQGRRTFEAGQIVESNLDLASLFRNKFRRVQAQPEPPGGGGPVGVATPLPAAPAGGSEPVAEQAAENAPTSPDKPAKAAKAEKDATKALKGQDRAKRGLDVTSRFPQAAEQDYRVFKHKGQYWVYDADDLATPLNAEGVDKDEVVKLVERELE